MRNTQVIILCGGLGTRLKEETEFRPKPMVPIGGKPIIWHIMKMYAHYGYTDFILPLGYKGEQIREFFANYRLNSRDVRVNLMDGAIYQLEGRHHDNWSITMVDTGQQTLKSKRLRLVEKYVEGQDVMITYGDGLGNVDIPGLLSFHKSHGKILTITGVSPAAQFGELEMSEEGRVINFREKEHISQHYVSGGFMVAKTAPFFEKLDTLYELETNTFENLTNAGDLMVYRHRGKWACMDTPRDADYLNELWNSGDAFWEVWS